MSPSATDPDQPDKRKPPAAGEPKDPSKDGITRPRNVLQVPAPAAPDDQPVKKPGLWNRLLSGRSLTSFLVSCGFHCALIVLLSMFVVFIPSREGRTLVISPSPDDGISPKELSDARVISPDSAPAGSAMVPLSSNSDLQLPVGQILRSDTQPSSRSPDPSTRVTPSDALLRTSNSLSGGFRARSGDLKGKMLGAKGGSEDTQRAVELGLAWLAAHQWQDGGWRLDLTEGPCVGRCRDSGTVATSTGATGLALLPFLGDGHTHLTGKYRDVVNNGLYYLKSRIVKTPHGADLQEGTMYAHGIATLALCEAYAMTQDEWLRDDAQQAVNFICHAQHSGGGWRYWPGQPGDTTVFGWQMMALKSATMAGLDVPSPVIHLGERFLDSVQSANGAYYGYLIRGKKPGPTAVGLLIRMYTGWESDDPRLARGAQFLADKGPSLTDMYFNYYATQVLFHFDEPHWPKWNETMSDYLVKRQDVSGHERGSWFFRDSHGLKGGRLYTTAVCTMILEVYYRHMPLYQEMAVDDEWW